jgi:hypothetical protein
VRVPVDLDTAADELYGVSPDDFIERRQQLVAEAKQARDRELATQIGKLRRPTRSAWLVNLLARGEPDNISALFELGAALQEAQQRMAGDELRQLSAERRKTVDAMARRAVELGRQQDYDAPDGALQEVGQTLQTALGDPEIADLVRAGRLTSAVTYGGGFGTTDLASALGASLPSKTPSRPEKAAEAPSPAPKRDAKQRREAEKAATEARERATEAHQTAESAEEEAEAATQRADDLADQVESLRTQLRQTEAAEREARDQARAARKQYQELRQAALSAEQAAAAAEQAVER